MILENKVFKKSYPPKKRLRKKITLVETIPKDFDDKSKILALEKTLIRCILKLE